MPRLPDCASVKSVEVLDGYRVRVRFDDGCVKKIDLEEVLLPAIGMTKRILEDLDYFRKVQVEDGALTWPNGVDICPDVLRFHLKTVWLENHPEIKTSRVVFMDLPSRPVPKAIPQRSSKATRTPARVTKKPRRAKGRVVNKLP